MAQKISDYDQYEAIKNKGTSPSPSQQMPKPEAPSKATPDWWQQSERDASRRAVTAMSLGSKARTKAIDMMTQDIAEEISPNNPESARYIARVRIQRALRGDMGKESQHIRSRIESMRASGEIAGRQELDALREARIAASATAQSGIEQRATIAPATEAEMRKMRAQEAIRAREIGRETESQSQLIKKSGEEERLTREKQSELNLAEKEKGLETYAKQLDIEGKAALKARREAFGTEAVYTRLEIEKKVEERARVDQLDIAKQKELQANLTDEAIRQAKEQGNINLALNLAQQRIADIRSSGEEEPTSQSLFPTTPREKASSGPTVKDFTDSYESMSQRNLEVILQDANKNLESAANDKDKQMYQNEINAINSLLNRQ